MRIDRQYVIHSARSQQLRIGRDQFLLVPVVDGEVEEAFSHEQVADATEYLRVVSLAQLRQQYSDGLHSFSLQGAGDHAGLVVELRRRGFNSLASSLWNRPPWHVIENERYRRRAQSQMFGQHLEAGAACGMRGMVGRFRHKRFVWTLSR